MEVKIYGLYDPTDNTESIRYVGKTIQSLGKRLQGHIDESIKNNPSTYKKNWINSLLSRNIRPKIKLIEICNESNWEEKERYWISNIQNLTNLTAGGENPDVIKTPIIRYSINGVREHYYEKIYWAELCEDLKLYDPNKRTPSDRSVSAMIALVGGLEPVRKPPPRKTPLVKLYQ